jgi:hypothetical protein
MVFMQSACGRAGGDGVGQPVPGGRAGGDGVGQPVPGGRAGGDGVGQPVGLEGTEYRTACTWR